jgi:hypothetical protein
MVAVLSSAAATQCRRSVEMSPISVQLKCYTVTQSPAPARANRPKAGKKERWGTAKPTQPASQAHPPPIGGKGGRMGGVAGRMYMEFPAVVDPRSGGMDAAVSTAIRRRRMAELAKGKLPYRQGCRFCVQTPHAHERRGRPPSARLCREYPGRGSMGTGSRGCPPSARLWREYPGRGE